MAETASRIDWVDYSKGICIVLVVMMHSTLGVENALGAQSWLHGFIEWARPFRMPDFFMLSGLFLASRIDRPWRAYIDTKLLHFAYFYVLWMTIQFALKAQSLYAGSTLVEILIAYAWGFIDPYATLWFIYLLAVFFLVVKALRWAPPVAILLVGAVLEMLPIETGNILLDEFAARFIYFYAGYLFASRIFAFADTIASAPPAALLAVFAAWACLNFWLVETGAAPLPLVSLALGFAGSASVVAAGVLLLRSRWADALRYCGENSIVIYLAFVLFMAPSRILLIKSGLIADPGIVSLAVTAAGIIGPLILFRIIGSTPLRFLFIRPAIFRLTPLSKGRFATS
ncbi:MAG: acyltransferase family protein [Aestuariivirgaceae bacterium]